MKTKVMKVLNNEEEKYEDQWFWKPNEMKMKTINEYKIMDNIMVIWWKWKNMW